jgi:hypothetical protein
VEQRLGMGLYMGRVSLRSISLSITTSFLVSSMSKRSKGARDRDKGRIIILGIRRERKYLYPQKPTFILQE